MSDEITRALFRRIDTLDRRVQDLEAREADRAAAAAGFATATSMMVGRFADDFRLNPRGRRYDVSSS